MSSGSTCAVSGCYNNTRKVKTFLETTFCVKHQKLRLDCMCPSPYFLHSMPRNEERQVAWLAALRLRRPPKRVYVCSFHFVDKRPSKLHPDPELYLGHDRYPEKKSDAETEKSVRRKHRQLVKNRKLLLRPETQSDNSSSNGNVTQDAEDTPDFSVEFTATVSDHTDISSSAPLPDPHCSSVHTQWEDPVRHDHDYYKTAGEKNVQDKMTQCDEIGYFMLQNDSDALLYTGIALEAFNILVSTVEGYASSAFTMSVRDQVLMTLMTLKTNREIDDLSRQFGVSQSTASKIISYWIDKLERVLRPLIPWLPKKTIQATMPEAFKKNFPNTTCILDCSESRIQKRKNPDSRKTVKYQVAVAPCGLVMFISATYGRRCSDTFITKDSGILEYLMPGDEVMALQGFTLKDLLFERKVSLVVPSVTKQHGQLNEEEVRATRQMAHHFKRATGRLKVYIILSQVVSNTMAPKIDKILRICAALVNLREDLIHDPC